MLASEPAAELLEVGDDALDGQTDPLFWDVVHTNETGARLIAEEAWPSLREAITADAGG